MNFFNKEFRKISLENIDKSNMFWAWIGSFFRDYCNFIFSHGYFR